MSQVETGPAPTAARRAATPDGRDRSRRPRGPRGLLSSELRLVFGRRRNQLLLALLALAPVFIGVAVKVSQPRGGDGPAFLAQVSSNGLFLIFTALTVAVPLLIPLLVGVVAGDSVAGEAGGGTLRYLLLIPTGRGRLLAAKAAGIAAYAAAAVLALCLAGLVAGGLLFGLHAVTLLNGSTVPLADGLARAALIGLYVWLSLLGFLAIGLFISTLTEVPVAAMAATIAVAIVSNVLDAVPQLGSFRSLLFTHHWLGFGEILRSPVSAGSVLGYLLPQLAYVAIFGAAAWARFTTSDISS